MGSAARAGEGPACTRGIRLAALLPLVVWAASLPARAQERADSIPLADSLPVSGFLLSRPADGAAAVSPVNLTLAWTELADAAGYVVELATDSTFREPLYRDSLRASANAVVLPDDVLEENRTYHWRVLARCGDRRPRCPTGQPVVAANAPYRFTTARHAFSIVPFRLRRAVGGPGLGEGATFSFLQVAGGETTFLADFALIVESSRPVTAGRATLGAAGSLEGKLATDDSRAENAWRLRAAAVLDLNLIDAAAADPGLVDGLYLALGAKLEADQEWEARRALVELLVTPTSRRLGAGAPLPRAGAPLRLLWRPILTLEAGHNRRPGGDEQESTLLRLAPRLHGQILLDGLRRALNLASVHLFADDTLVLTPLEEGRRAHNFLVAGLELRMSENFGLAFTYKNGRPAPRFERVETFGGGLSVLF